MMLLSGIRVIVFVLYILELNKCNKYIEWPLLELKSNYIYNNKKKLEDHVTRNKGTTLIGQWVCKYFSNTFNMCILLFWGFLVTCCFLCSTNSSILSLCLLCIHITLQWTLYSVPCIEYIWPCADSVYSIKCRFISTNLCERHYDWCILQITVFISVIIHTYMLIIPGWFFWWGILLSYLVLVAHQVLRMPFCTQLKS